MRAPATLRRSLVLAVGGVVVLALLLQASRTAGWLGGDADGALVVTADFADTTGLYVGNDVTYLGVHIGEVTEVQPEGTTMRVVMHLDPGTELPRDAGAEILQSSLVTDRYVELGPAYTGGPTLASGAHIDASHTRAPATIDQVASAVDDLVRALDAGFGKAAGGKSLGKLLGTTAAALDGNGGALRRALSESRDALAVINSKDASLTTVTDDLVQLVDVLAQRDRTIRRFTAAAATTTGVLSDQRGALVATLTTLDELVRRTDAFLRAHGGVLTDDLSALSRVVDQVRAHQASLAEAFDVMPTMAENFARAYDWRLGRLRVQFAFSAGPFSAAFRSHTCEVFAGALGGPVASGLCAALFNEQGTGILDAILDGVYDGLPGGIP